LKVVQESDLYYGIEKPTKSRYKLDGNNIESVDQTYDLTKVKNDIPKRIERDTECIKYSSTCNVMDPRYSLWIQVNLSAMEEPSFVEGICSICLSEFEVNDTFIVSTRKVCNHCFHHECALRWLSSGKKRCPICRQFFVPGIRVDDQDVICHGQYDCEAYIPPQMTSLGDTEEIGKENSVTNPITTKICPSSSEESIDDVHNIKHK
jgi:hypothetical protein